MFFYPWLFFSGVTMEHLKKLLDDYSLEQLSDIEKFINLYEQIPQEKKSVFMLIINAYMEGLMAGSDV